ncbi:AtpZ/AtpI family protein [Patescibacteria group bacterium]|nr:AtpZ/AtpI family protein [Patescibacteria group bacterium]MBU1448379.1 AtpZ/AtpI family protein [Patescibacteria group bacterium]MBU2613051.1 AtpZ/AtpI family protein [Patescibacteria group bacterium]
MEAPETGEGKTNVWMALGIVWDIGIAVAVPTVVSALGGRWLDTRFGTSPLFLILGLFVALVVSGILVVRMGRRIVTQL